MIKEDLKKVLSWFSLFILIIFAVILIFLFNGYLQVNSLQEMKTCGDGTFYNSCSVSQPFFCSDFGQLIEKATVCGCSSGDLKKEDGCNSNLFKNERVVSFEYFLNGERKEISLSLYKGVNDYVQSLPRSKFYFGGETPKRSDFKFLKIEDTVQINSIQKLVIQIQNAAPESKENQARIAISLVQNIPYGDPSENNAFDETLNLSKFPYQVLYENSGSCEGKSELLVLLLRELGYGTAFFYYAPENHEAVGIKCPIKESLLKSGYCFVETTSPSILGDYGGEYLGTGKLLSEPEIIMVGEGISLPEKMEEYEDGKRMMNLRLGKSLGVLFRDKITERLSEKYGLEL